MSAKKGVLDTLGHTLKISVANIMISNQYNDIPIGIHSPLIGASDRRRLGVAVSRVSCPDVQTQTSGVLFISVSVLENVWQIK